MAFHSQNQSSLSVGNNPLSLTQTDHLNRHIRLWLLNHQSAEQFSDGFIVIECNYDDEAGESQCEQGTGFYLKDIGWVSCHHVVCDDDGNPYKEIEAHWSGDLKNRHTVTVVKSDKHRDIALLELVDAKGRAVTPTVELEGRSTFTQGQNVLVVGFPSYTPNQPAFIADSSIATAYIKSAVSVFELTTHVAGGISGGPVIDTDDKVVGMTTKGVRGGMGSNLAVACKEISAVADS